jgi:hypothetical protein
MYISLYENCNDDLRTNTCTKFNYWTVLSILCSYCELRVIMGSGDSVVGIATGYWLDDRGVGVRVPVGSRIFTSPNRADWL